MVLESRQFPGGRTFRFARTRTLVIGSGCAGLAAADDLWDLGERDLLLMTEGMDLGTSRNSGSDKQTYYKLALCGDTCDSVGKMAASLCSRGAHGDLALVMAACSAQCFFRLVQLGIPFPTNEYGEFVGYRTDHDDTCRATSAGPLTSQMMTEGLERSVRQKDIPVLEGMLAFELLVVEGRVVGALALSRPDNALVVVLCAHVVLATGGPAHVYFDSVYPKFQSGMSSLALLAGATAENLDQWQYGLASTQVRWNVSGSYQQAIPRYVSVDSSMAEHDFLSEFYAKPADAVNACFLKGYQWPFDAQKGDGSSRIDLLVHEEGQKHGRRVYMDFTRNPSCLDAGFGPLKQEAADYLQRCGALLPKPIERLCAINAAAAEFYRARGLDLEHQMLEVAVCAQHCNGGIAVDIHWQAGIAGLYAVGEVAATFGAYRPGGSALNATQVGALRAAQHIAHQSLLQAPSWDECAGWLMRKLDEPLMGLDMAPAIAPIHKTLQRSMSDDAALVRHRARMAELERAVKRDLSDCYGVLPPLLPRDMWERLKLRDQRISTLAALSAMRLAADELGSNGSALVADPGPASETARLNRNVLTCTRLLAGECETHLAEPRPMVQGEQWFETAWKAHRP